MSSSEIPLNHQSHSPRPPKPLFQRFWNGGGRFAVIFVPSFLALHYMWFKLQRMEEFTPKDKQKDLVRAGPFLLDRDENITLIKPKDFTKKFEMEDRKAGK